MESLWKDVRFALRTLGKNRGFTLAAVVTLAIGIGATTAVFSIAYGVLLQALPYPRPDRLVAVSQIDPKGRLGNMSDPNFRDLHEQNHSLAAMAVYNDDVFSVAGGSEPVRVGGAYAGRDFFDVLGVHPVLGRGFAPEELHEGAPPVALVSYEYWTRYLGSDPNLEAHRLLISGQSVSVVGVMPRGFSFPPDTMVWTPRELFPELPSRTALNWQVAGRLKDGVTVEQARADLGAIARRLKEQFRDDTWMSDAAVVPMIDQMVGSARLALGVLMGATGALLLLACANVAGLLLARTVGRRRELAVRVALGATRWRVTRQLLMESLCLALAGGALGVLLAYWGVQTIIVSAGAQLPRAGEIQMSWPVVFFAVAASLLTAVAIGLGSAWKATRTDPQDSLGDSQRGGTEGRSLQRLRGGLVISQLAVSLVLLAGAGLLARSFLLLLDVQPGFRVKNVLTVGVALESSDDPQAGPRRAALMGRLLERLGALPGVEDAGVVSTVPLGADNRNGTFLVMAPGEELKDPSDFERLFREPSRTGTAFYRVASEGYFRAMGIPLVRGRMFNERDVADAPH